MGRKLLAAVLCALLCFGMLAAPVRAATAEQDGLSVVLVTDKTDYAAQDAITATLTVKNNGIEAVENLVLESIIPEGYVLAAGEAKKTVELLAPGYSMQLQVKLLAEGVQESAAPVPTEQPAKQETPAPTDADEDSTEISAPEETAQTGGETVQTEAPAEQPEAEQPDKAPEQSDAAASAEKEEAEEALLVVNEQEAQRSFPWWLVILMIVLAAAAIILVIVMRKKGAALVLCFVMAGTVLAGIAVPVQAAMQEKLIVVKESVTVDGAQLFLRATVAYHVQMQSGGSMQQPAATSAPTPAPTVMPSLTPTPTPTVMPTPTPMPSTPSEAEQYFAEHGTIVKVQDAETSTELMTEGKAVNELSSRGFESFPVTYMHNTAGDRSDATEAKPGSVSKHPMYTTFYRAENGELWTIYVVDGNVMASPVGYNLSQTNGISVVISETGSVVTYDDSTNQFIENIPDGSVCVVKTVSKINAQTLETLTKEELDKR